TVEVALRVHRNRADALGIRHRHARFAVGIDLQDRVVVLLRDQNVAVFIRKNPIRTVACLLPDLGPLPARGHHARNRSDGEISCRRLHWAVGLRRRALRLLPSARSAARSSGRLSRRARRLPPDHRRTQQRKRHQPSHHFTAASPSLISISVPKGSWNTANPAFICSFFPRYGLSSFTPPSSSFLTIAARSVISSPMRSNALPRDGATAPLACSNKM